MDIFEKFNKVHELMDYGKKSQWKNKDGKHFLEFEK